MPHASNVSVGKPNVTGAVSRAPLGTSLPTNATAALAEGFNDLGYVSEDGVTNSNSPSSQNIKAWGGAIVYAYQDEKPDTMKLKLIEALNPEVHKAVYGSDNVEGTLESGITITANAKEAEESAWVIDMALRENTMKRIVIPDGKVTQVGDIVYVDNNVIGYDITITCLPDESGNTHYEYLVRVPNTSTLPIGG